MSALSKPIYIVSGLLVIALAGAIFYGLSRLDDNSRPHNQEGFKGLMEKKVHGRELFDGFASDPTPSRRKSN